MFKYVDIGTAKPSIAERQRVPHHLFDFIEPPHKITAGDFYRRARSKIAELIVGGPVFVVGGSGFYLQALEKGMFEVEDVSSEVREKYEEWIADKGLDWAYSEYVKRDPESAQKVSDQDRYRILRALTVMETTGKTMTQLQSEFSQSAESFPYPLVKVGLTISRDILRERVRHRLNQMFDAGWIEEVRQLLSQGYGSWWPLMSVGYKEVVDHLEGRLPSDELLPEIEKNTMRLAKRQMTWFKRDSEIVWFDSLKQREQAESYILQCVSEQNK
jgi:tRNA dimethylallyltransferase